MKFRAALISIAIISLCLSYLLFGSQQYFSVVAMSLIFALALISAFIFLNADASLRFGKKAYLIASAALLVLIGVYEVLYLHPTADQAAFSLRVLSIVSVAVAISLGGVYLTAREFGRSKEKGWMTILTIVACLALTSMLAFLVMYGFNPTSWNGVDEVAYNYYAASLFDRGINPYVTTMQPILDQRHILPTLQLDGTYEYAYSYPALSFLLFLPIPLLGITSFYSFIAIVVALCVFVSYFLYYKSGFNKTLFLPLGVWLLFSFVLVGATTHYIALAVFVLLAYFERKNALLSGVFLGLAASTIQLAWFFIPFFYVLELREFGKKQLFKQVATSVLIFIAINAYFIALSPQQTITNIFGLLGPNKLPPYGTNLMQLSYAFYSLPYWYSTFISLAVFALFLVLFYFYTKTLLPAIAVVPAMIFFLSWRNIPLYSLPAIPLLLAAYYCHSGTKDLIQKKRHITCAIAALALLGVTVAIYSHALYVQNPGIKISSIMPVIYISSAGGANQYSLGGLVANVISGEQASQNVSFYMASRSPNNEAYVPGSLLPKLEPGQPENYTINFQLGLVGNSTRIFLMAFTKDRITSSTINITIRPPSAGGQP